MSLTKDIFGTLPDGRAASLYTLTNGNGLTAKITDYGGTLVSLLTPDRNGTMGDVICGYDTLDSYVRADGYLGVLVGRFANRIGKGRFELDGVTYDGLYINDGDNHLHGGKYGFSSRLWTVKDTMDEEEPALLLTYISPDGEENYPGTLTVTVTYTLTADNALSIHYVATTDKATPVNLTNHAYFNLGGYENTDILSHELTLDAASYLATDEGLIPTGEIIPVDGTPFDFRVTKTIGQDFYADNRDFRLAGGYDHCFNFTDWQKCHSGGDIVYRGSLYDPTSGRKMDLLTNQPCVQVYSGNFLKNPNFPLRGGLPQKTQRSLCLETQMMPDSMNHEGFTDCILRPKDVYDHTTVYRFSVSE